MTTPAADGAIAPESEPGIGTTSGQRIGLLLLPPTAAELFPSGWTCESCGAHTDDITRNMCERCRVIGGLLEPREVVDPDLREALGLAREG